MVSPPGPHGSAGHLESHLVFNDDGRDHGHVREVSATVVGVVKDDHITPFQVLRRVQRLGHRSGMLPKGTGRCAAWATIRASSSNQEQLGIPGAAGLQQCSYPCSD